MRQGDLFGFFTSIVAKHQKTKGGPFGEFFFSKNSQGRKTERGTLQSRPVLYVTRKTLFVQFPRPNGPI